MILTESDLHAYNRGELSAEATRLLEEDPLALQDAARLRLIGEALREEAEIPIVGRAETLARLRSRSSTPIGIPRWVWGVGVAAVFSLIVVTIPDAPQPAVRYQFATYRMPNSEAEPVAEAKADLSGAVAGSIAAAPAGPAVEERARRAPQADGSAAVDQPTVRPEMESQSQARAQGEIGGIDVARSASLDLRVDDTIRAKAEAEALTKRLGGFVADDSLSRPNDRPTATLTLRVPSARMEVLVAGVKALGGPASEASAVEDVTSERIDSEARLSTMIAEEKQLRALLVQTKNVGEILRVRERLSNVRAEIESLTVNLKTLKGRVELATLNVTLTQRPRPGAPALEDGWPRDSVGGAVNLLCSLGRRAVTATIYVGVFAPIWLPILIFTYIRARRR